MEVGEWGDQGSDLGELQSSPHVGEWGEAEWGLDLTIGHVTMVDEQ